MNTNINVNDNGNMNDGHDMHELNQLPRIFIKGLIVILIALLPVFLLNHAMQSFLDEELAIVQLAAEKAAAAQQALLEASEAEQERLQAELNVLKAQQYEEFYQQYKNRESYHYYGQFYEMFENMYSADVIFLGTSRAAHGINPLYIEQENPDHSFYNFALNGANPKYYLDWYKVFKESGYPTPETIVFCVDWFFCDDSWLWRRIEFDDSPDKPIDIMRKIRDSKQKSASSAAPQQTADTIADTSADTTSDSAVTEKSETVSGEKINFWDVDALMTSVFNKIPVIYSRDRIPEMLKHYLGIGKAKAMEPSETDVSEGDENADEALPEVPVYKHTYLMDGAANITSDFYKGFIPWEVPYGGDFTIAGCNDTEEEWKALTELLDQFTSDGIKIIFVQAPEYIKGRKAIKFEQNNERLSKLAETYGIPFLNYNEELASEINDRYTNFSDWGHLNKKGSTSFSKVLGKDLKDLLD